MDVDAEGKVSEEEEDVAPYYELLIGYAFASDCICNGFFHFKATPRVVKWLQELLIWLYNHPYEHDQR